VSNPATNSYEVSGGVITNAGLTQVKRQFATGATIATHTLVAGVTAKKIRVLAFFITTVDGLNLLFKSASTTISANIAASGVMSTYCPHGWFETAAGEALGFAIDAAESTSVQVVYCEVD
jgi:hypothetical protein